MDLRNGVYISGAPLDLGTEVYHMFNQADQPLTATRLSTVHILPTRHR